MCVNMMLLEWSGPYRISPISFKPHVTYEASLRLGMGGAVPTEFAPWADTDVAAFGEAAPISHLGVEEMPMTLKLLYSS